MKLAAVAGCANLMITFVEMCCVGQAATFLVPPPRSEKYNLDRTPEEDDDDDTMIDPLMCDGNGRKSQKQNAQALVDLIMTNSKVQMKEYVNVALYVFTQPKRTLHAQTLRRFRRFASSVALVAKEKGEGDEYQWWRHLADNAEDHVIKVSHSREALSKWDRVRRRIQQEPKTLFMLTYDEPHLATRKRKDLKFEEGCEREKDFRSGMLDLYEHTQLVHLIMLAHVLPLCLSTGICMCACTCVHFFMNACMHFFCKGT